MTKRVVVVGSGASGMTAGVLLAREGCDVRVLEQHGVVGGLMQSYRRYGHTISTGVHCLGGLREGQILWRYLKYLGVFDRIRLFPMPDDCATELLFNGWSFRIPVGYEAFTQRLIERFPNEHVAIRYYIELARDLGRWFALYDCRQPERHTPPRDYMVPLRQYLDQLTDNEKLKRVLSGHALLHGVEPRLCPLYVHLLAIDSFIQSSYRLDHEHCSLSDAFDAALIQQGGKVLLERHVTKILTENGRVSGVRCGEQVHSADAVVFTGHPSTLIDLCTDGALRSVYRQRLGRLVNTQGAFGVMAAWPEVDCPAARHNFFLHIDADEEAVFRQRMFSHGDRPAQLYCAAQPHNGSGSTLAALTVMHPDEVRPWSQSHTGLRPAEYQDQSRRAAARIIHEIERVWPQVKGRLEVIDTVTPLTFRDYTLTPEGSCYGVKRAGESMFAHRIDTATRVRGLYLAGQSVVMSGILGAVISGVLAAVQVLGDETLVDRIRTETS